MIIIAKGSSDTDGQLIVRHLSGLIEFKRTARISRVKTLDGGAVVTHNGVCAADDDIDVTCNLSLADFGRLQGWYENSTWLRLSYWGGSYSGYIYSLGNDRKQCDIKFYIDGLVTS